MRKLLSRVGLSVSVLLLTSPAFAQFTPTTIDTADAVSQLGEIGTAIAAVGGALMVAGAIAVAFKWAKAALFG